MTYEILSGVVKTWGMLFFVFGFAIALAYALWPKNYEKFRRAARAPLDNRSIED